MTYPNEAQELAYAWESTGYPLDEIAEMHLKIKELLEEEKEHSAFLEKLLSELYGEGWEKLTLAGAKQLRNTGG